jgi:aspartate-semialdehyde dehydrogenase
MWSLSEYNKAGRSPGVRTLDILDNIIPFIPKEEAKVNKEFKNIGRKV